MDWTSIVEAVLALAGLLGLGTAVAKLYSDGKKWRQALAETETAIKSMWQLIVEANADKNVTQAEFDKIMEGADAVMKDFDAILAQSQIIISDLYGLRDAVVSMVSVWRAAGTAPAAPSPPAAP